MVDFTKIALSSSYNTDKIVFTASGTVSIASLPDEYNSFGTIIKRLTIAHGQTRPLFIDFRFSLDGGTTWKTGGSGEYAIGYSTSTNLNILYFGSTGTFTYEVFGSWIDGYDGTNPYVEPVQTDAKTYFDSRLRYRKVIGHGHFISSGSTPTSISHTQGTPVPYSVYFTSRPNEVWQEHSGGVKNKWLFDFSMVECFSYSTASNVVVETSVSTDVWYKVYGNG